MKMKIEKNKKGFTLVEMLVVIAIIAILVALVIPAISDSVKKAKASTDAANLRSILSVLNIEYLDGNKDFAKTKAAAMSYECKSFKGADTYAVFSENGAYIEVYYVKDSVAYSIDYFATIASGKTSAGTTVSDIKALYGESNFIELKKAGS